MWSNFYFRTIVRWRYFLFKDFLFSGSPKDATAFSAGLTIGVRVFDEAARVFEPRFFTRYVKAYAQRIELHTYAKNGHQFLNELETMARVIANRATVVENITPNRKTTYEHSLHSWLVDPETKQVYSLEDYVKAVNERYRQLYQAVEELDEADRDYYTRMYLPLLLDTPQLSLALKKYMWEK